MPVARPVPAKSGVVRVAHGRPSSLASEVVMLPALVSGAAGVVGGLLNRNSAKDAAEKNAALQREFAQNGITWKVKDAERAGVHPLYALGASTIGASPSYVGDTSLGSGIASMGQDVGRALAATSSTAEKDNAFTAAARALELEKGGLENELLRSQIARMRQQSMPSLPTATGNPWLIDGQGDSRTVTVGPLIENNPMPRISSDPERPWAEPGAINELGYARTSSGGWAPVPSADVKQRIEDNIFAETAWFIRNNVLPSLGLNQSPPPVEAPPGTKMLFDPLRQEYRPHKSWYGINY